MAKKTAVIDIGSNSMRMVVYERTSRFGFHLIKEVKTKVRIGEGAYKLGGELQEEPMSRAFSTLRDFGFVANSLGARKILCVATSAMRDAPNNHIFVKKVKKELGIHIKVIDGNKEAFLGGIAVANLLPKIDDATTIDIGGGSTELAKIQNGKVVATHSLNLGTVRLKELFRSESNHIENMNQYINKILITLPDEFKTDNIIAIGGTLRAISKSIMQKEGFILPSLHAFNFSFKEHKNQLHKIITCNLRELKSYGIKKDRHDTIQEGTLIFKNVIEKLGSDNIIASGVGVRDGVFLNDLLRNNNLRFPENFNPNLRSLLDRFDYESKASIYHVKIVNQLFDILKPLHEITDEAKPCLQKATRLANVGKSLSYYEQHEHSFYFLMQNLLFGLTPRERVTISTLVKFQNNKLPNSEFYSQYKSLLPSPHILKWLSFILTLAKRLNANLTSPKLEFKLKNNCLYIKSNCELYLAKSNIQKLQKPTDLDIIFE